MKLQAKNKLTKNFKILWDNLFQWVRNFQTQWIPVKVPASVFLLLYFSFSPILMMYKDLFMQASLCESSLSVQNIFVWCCPNFRRKWHTSHHISSFSNESQVDLSLEKYEASEAEIHFLLSQGVHKRVLNKSHFHTRRRPVWLADNDYFLAWRYTFEFFESYPLIEFINAQKPLTFRKLKFENFEKFCKEHVFYNSFFCLVHPFNQRA